MKVLIGVDDSAHADTTLAFVQRLSWPADTAVVVCSAVAPPHMAYSSSKNHLPLGIDVGGWDVAPNADTNQDASLCGFRVAA